VPRFDERLTGELMMNRRLIAALALSASPLVFASAIAQATQPADAAAPQPDVTDQTQEVVVTGSRAANRTVADSPVPIDVISSESLTANGTGETNKILNQLVPSFNFPQPSIADGSDVIRPATLRGLSPDQTLVLINGKRRHVSSLLNINGTVGRGSAAVDLNTIPALAIDKIEVLRDGASSQYGSDAIAGVINIQLKHANHGEHASISYGKYITQMSGVPELQSLQTNGGQPFFDPADATGTASSRYLAGKFGDEATRHDGGTWVIGANLGLPIGQGFLNITGEFRDRNAVNRAGYDMRPNYIRPIAAFDPREVNFNRLNFQLGDPETKDYNIFVNAGMPLGDTGFEFYSFGSYAHRDGLSAANWRQQSNAANRDFSQLPAGVAPTAANFVAIYPDGFLPFIGSDYDDFSIAAGVKGDLGPWSVDLSGVYGHNQIDYRTLNSINTSYGSAGPHDVDSGGIRFGQFTANLDVTREFELGFAKPVTFAFGAEYRNENFKERPGQVESYAPGPYAARGAAIGQQGFPGIPASAKTDNSRHSMAAYAELDTDLIKGLTATVAGRFEHFSDFGNTVNGKLALRYEIMPALAIRGSISNGFRAPSLHQQYFTTTSTNFVAGVPVDIVTAQVNSPIARALGAKPLNPEKSLNFSGGVTSNPFRGFNITADYFYIRIKDRIVLTENLGSSGNAATDAAARAALNANGFTSIGAARFFINGLNTTTQGVDIVGTYRLKLEELGNWSLSAAYNYTDNKIDKRLNNLGPFAADPNLVLFGRVEGIRFTDGQPRDKVVLSADGTIGIFGVTARTTRYGRVIAPTATAPVVNKNSLTDLGPDDVILHPRWVTDLEGRVTLYKHVTLALGANNLFDVYPNRLPYGPRPASAGGGQYPANQIYIPYSGFSPFGFNGRYLYGRINVDF
jgi:iron complex outermembrane receptor protein